MFLRHDHPTHRTPRPEQEGAADGERGVVLVLAALTMVSMLVIAALVVDIGAVYAERRQDQNAADAAALAGLQDLSDRDEATKNAIDYAGLPDAEWNSCASDAGALAVRSPGFNCVSFDTVNSRIRVRIPTRWHKTAFGGIIGKEKLPHNAFATAGLTQQGFGGVLPFGMPSGAGSGDGYACIKANSNGQSEPPCKGSESGNFGTIDIGLFGNEDLGTSKHCGSGHSRTDRIPNNIAVGSDHQLGISGGPVLIDAPFACENQKSLPNAAMTETGNHSQHVDKGFLSGNAGDFSDSGPARLKRSDDALFAGAGKTIQGGKHTGVDNNGLWMFIPQNLTGDVPASCHREQFVDADGNPTLKNPKLPFQVQNHVASMKLQDGMLELLRRCFSHYNGNVWTGGGVSGAPAMTPPEPRTGCAAATPSPCTGAVFSADATPGEKPNLHDLQYSPRFAYVPEMVESSFSSGKSTVHFKKFRAVYVQRLVLGTGKDTVRFDPGVSEVITDEERKDSGTLREVTAFVFPEGMLPNGLGLANAPYEFGVNRFGSLVR